ncbi:MAG: CHAD domain-containing protein [Ignavibacteria bacterium]|nr:CHAD domain-containing protein [Ignavibacteria bacterium]
MFLTNNYYLAGSKSYFKFFINHLDDDFTVETEEVKNCIISIFDTFDWRLFRSGKSLIFSGSNYHFGNQESGYSSHKLKKKIVFADDIAETGFRNILSSVTGCRRICRNFRFKQKRTVFKVLNKDGKTISRLHLYEYVPLLKSHGVKAAFIKIEKLKGYSKYSGKIEALTSEYSIFPFRGNWTEKIISLTGNVPGSYSSKPKYEIDADMPAWLAMKIIYGKLFANMKLNEEGIKNNLDPEFLHDFRVAIRCTRSALSQINKVFPKETQNHFRQTFKYIQNATNASRDIDVDILNKSDYKNILPLKMHTGIDLLVKYLKKERSKEQQNLIRLLRSEKYVKAKKEWTDFLQSVNENISDLGNTFLEISALSAKKIIPALEKTIAAGDIIVPKSPDEQFHKFRISLKKLRYLLEFFSGIYPEEQMDIILYKIKALQDNLGEFNDLSIQQQKLTNYLLRIRPKPETAKIILPAVGGLIAVKSQRKMQVREEFFILYSQFRKKRNIKIFYDVFGKG